MVTYELSSEVHGHQPSQQCWGKPCYLHQRFLGEKSPFGEGEDRKHTPLPLVNSTYWRLLALTVKAGPPSDKIAAPRFGCWWTSRVHCLVNVLVDLGSMPPKESHCYSTLLLWARAQSLARGTGHLRPRVGHFLWHLSPLH